MAVVPEAIKVKLLQRHNTPKYQACSSRLTSSALISVLFFSLLSSFQASQHE
jgi:hypothetical protein